MHPCLPRMCPLYRGTNATSSHERSPQFRVGGALVLASKMVLARASGLAPDGTRACVPSSLAAGASPTIRSRPFTSAPGASASGSLSLCHLCIYSPSLPTFYGLVKPPRAAAALRTSPSLLPSRIFALPPSSWRPGPFLGQRTAARDGMLHGLQLKQLQKVVYPSAPSTIL
ncbi:hypothetical protein BDY21DRAFT_160788 [Lineolata rhizophorae]|uniref:Uncharacterized protein n=1 Tax=Lineolata rhizophorae TaxID=578093 RepID=A0A6A6P8I1_9PEZI|nr:hypothetical protein BDY21DRAFT_160788 [Lineolata rhizophorae]